MTTLVVPWARPSLAYPNSVGLFIYRGEATVDEIPARGIVGAWCASGDSAGRSYPIIVFGSYDYNLLVATGAALPIALWSLLSAAYDLATHAQATPVDVFLERVSSIELPSLDDPEAAGAAYREWLATQPMKALWDASFGTDSKRFWVLQSMSAAIEPFKGQELPKTNLCLRLPIGAGDAYAAAVWMDITLRLAKWRHTLPNAFWSPQRALLLHIGAPHVATYRELISPTSDANYVADLCSAPRGFDATARGDLGALDALVARTDLSLATFLEGLS